MSAGAVYSFAPAVLPTQAAAQKLWRIRWLMREHALDPRAADTHLRALRDHPNARVASLAGHTAAQAIACRATSAPPAVPS